MMHSTDKAIYFFKGAQSAAGSSTACPASCRATPRRCAATRRRTWGWEAFLTGIDAAIQRRQRQDLPVLRQVVRYSSFGQAFDPGYPTTIAANWRGLPASFEAGIDAAMWRGDNDKTYFFKGPQYVRLTAPPLIRTIQADRQLAWHPASFREGIDAALWRTSNQKVYLFKGGQYVRLTGVTMDDTYPLPVSNWNLPDDWSSGIDAALMRLDTGQIYFFRGRRFIQMTSVSDGPDGGYPTWIDRRWMPPRLNADAPAAGAQESLTRSGPTRAAEPPAGPQSAAGRLTPTLRGQVEALPRPERRISRSWRVCRVRRLAGDRPVDRSVIRQRRRRRRRRGWSRRRASEGSMPSSFAGTKTWRRLSVKPWLTGRMRSAWPAATGRSPSAVAARATASSASRRPATFRRPRCRST